MERFWRRWLGVAAILEVVGEGACVWTIHGLELLLVSVEGASDEGEEAVNEQDEFGVEQ